ncbi:cupin domain-containing protein [Dactylosporangium darangshiense]|uniref:Cupin type-2 domain-containing protein n=1 Tax=Dactylosporangium darangshiense TaxID=579108 RepID=A0ABP8DRS2_9ACTN
MSIVRAADAPRFELNGAQFVVYAGPSHGSKEICTWRLTVPGGSQSIPHTLDRDEVFVVLSGAIRITPDGEVLTGGDSAVVPAGERIELGNPSDEPAEVQVALKAGVTAYHMDGSLFGTPPWAA